MAMTIHVDVVSAESLIFSGVAEFFTAPAEGGEVGIYPRHAPLLTRIRPGAVRIKLANTHEPDVILYVSGGLLEVQPHSITVLADTAIRGTDIDEAKAREAKAKAEEALKNRKTQMDFAMAQAELVEAVAKLAVIEKLKKRGH
ncbi:MULTISPECIES: F0F1 ATP synthase subunit epsilon [Silvimonas]|uniref:ATP synthase epsilon chain n=2 Tax=Silvimonas TaxID=300264 RepID=A0A840RHL9_9NEIS|nr:MULTISPECIES: F0F1 ATP synthase subunit epsilon [Silvimonas]MBB5192018.1 F-type H+-transporting ATPase subunit epsilon [Silvimonas terrae]GGP25802.1 ATP synthase epsilon chain [Silvimonas amylolytica]